MSSKRYYSFGQYLRKKYPFKVRKITLDAGFTCPNRDGSKARGGCIYCDNRSFSPNTVGPAASIREQVERGINFYKSRYGVDKFIVYFQAYTNTYAPVDHLKTLYDQALNYPGVVGLSIGTRPDCVPDDVLDLIESYTKRVDVWLELGLQSIHNRTMELTNRAHTYEDFLDAVRRARGRGFEMCVHTIFGLPGETHEMMMQTAEAVAEMGLEAIKIHHLYVSPNTALEKMYRRGEVPVFALEQWAGIAADVLERIPPTMAVQRLMGELGGDYVVAPRWDAAKDQVLRAIEGELERRGSYQGKLYAERRAAV